jgi:hypothetical protein
MLITKKDGLLTGRAIVWEVDGVTILDRIYTCFDYLENCFIDYAKEHKWWIRTSNSLLSTGDDQTWYTPDDDYQSTSYREFKIVLDRHYDCFPYVDSFRYFDGDRTISTHNGPKFALDSTEGDYRGEVYQCHDCGRTFYGYDSETPEGLFWSEYADCYLCEDCCWYSDGMDDYIPNSDDPIYVHGKYGGDNYPESYVDEWLIEDPDGSEDGNNIVLIDDEYYFVTNRIIFNVDTKKYEVRSNSN